MAFPEGQMISLGDVELEVFQAGQGGIPVVMAHGWPEHAYSWRYQMPALADAGYHVIVPNQRGYGRSSQPESVEHYDCHHMTGDYNALLDALGIEKAVFVGHDWGAILVWHHCLLNPERVVGAANLSVPFRPREEADPVAFWEQVLGQEFYIVHFNRQPGVAAKAFESNPRQFLTNMYRTEQWLDKDNPEGMGGASIIHLAERALTGGRLMMSEAELNIFVEAFERSGFHAPCNWYRNFTRNWETTADVEQKVVQPALMIYGAHDMVPQTDMAGYVDDLEVHTLDCGHWIQQEKPQETNRILLAWLDRRMKPLFPC
ncbi:MAG: alpha/beta hydrolase [Pseudomonadales bacterium]|nr:alpha/beta hydrolase [Pseudomonadales bacterium]MBO6566836.1 alpha/beta hydrolase [Pseudomonadales bacterium]MBO6594753.1 alpha/beta hydrolase [Pseudomonadales bacterium]MBO6656558.1 alpha/beta hydrolase [Pseudomonadales bacterium]MBO6701259.1 alpha/beta hydrolase [Pseudomonadales bacterium]